MDNQSGRENLHIINNQSEYIGTYLENIRDIVPFLHNNRYVDKVEEKMDVAEKEGKSKYTYLSDLEVIYYFVHLQKDMDEKKNRKEGSVAKFSKWGSTNKTRISYAKQNFIKKKPISCTLRDNRLLTTKLSV
ncbi:hypothetical protein ABEY53_30280, partial [Bacillus mycoides]